MKPILSASAGICALALAAGCTPTIKTQNEITVKPIQMTVDINLKVVDQELNKALVAPDDAKADANSKDVRERRRARRDQIKAWKSALLIGENNAGLLEARGTLSDPVKKVVDAENNDRREVFESVAKKENITLEAVAQRWAVRTHDRADEGTLVQDAAGNWSVKGK